MIFGFWKRPYDLTPQHVSVDVHSHLLPGVDDGVRTFDEAMQIITQLAQLGYTSLILTPHIYPEVFDNEETALLAVFSEFRNQVRRHQPDVRLHLGAEYWLDERLLRQLFDQPSQLLRMGPNRDHVLIELSTLMQPAILPEVLEQCQRRSLRPIIAHVERYPYAHGSNFTVLRRWKEQGALLQMNLGSPAGQYGRAVAQTANNLWRANVIDLLGSDLHNAQNVACCQQGWEQLCRWPGAAQFDPAIQAALA